MPGQTEFTEKEWNEKGVELFGLDRFKWAFKCPLCGNIATAEDFRKFADKGARPDSAYQECLGRYTGGIKGEHGCDWCAYGLFRGPVSVKTENGLVYAFEFHI